MNNDNDNNNNMRRNDDKECVGVLCADKKAVRLTVIIGYQSINESITSECCCGCIAGYRNMLSCQIQRFDRVII